MGTTLSEVKDNIIVMDEKRFDEITRPKSYGPSICYLGICLIFAFLLMALTFFYVEGSLYGELPFPSLNYALFDAGLMTLNMLVGFIVFNFLITHLSASILGAKKSLQKTFQISTHSFTPYLLLGWVWILGFDYESLTAFFSGATIVIALLAYTNLIIGLKRVHRLSYLKAVVAGLITPVLISLLFGILMGMYGAELGLVSWV